MKTLYEYVAPEAEGGVKVRLIERKVTPQARKSFAVIVDASSIGKPAMFDNFHDLEFAASSFALVLQRIGAVDAPVPVFWP